MTETVEFCGTEFHVSERVGLMPMMRYARVVKRAMQREKSGAAGDGSDEIELFDATLSLLEQCVHPDDWDRFERVTTEQGADLDQYMEFSGQVMAVVAARPTGRSTDSSDGPRTIEPSSTVVSYSPGTESVVRRFNENGRPDLALLVRRRQESLSA